MSVLRKRISIELDPLLSISGEDGKFELNITQQTTVDYLFNKAMKFFENELSLEGNIYQLFPKAPGKFPLESHDCIVASPLNEFVLKKSLFEVTVFIESTETKEIFTLSPTMTVQDAVSFMERSSLKGAVFDRYNVPRVSPPVSHDLILVPSKTAMESKARGIRMEYGRSLNSYRLSSADTLMLGSFSGGTNRWNNIITSGQDTELIVICSCEEFGIQKTLKFNSESTFQNVLDEFFKKAKVPEISYFYELSLSIPGLPNEVIELPVKLASFPLPSPIKLICSARKRPTIASFGTDPSTLPHVTHWGLEIPEILFVLYKILENNDGFQTPGIFRMAGQHDNMLCMIHDYDTGAPIHSNDVHCAATLIKRWFMMLPKRIFWSISEETLKENPEAMRIAHTKLRSQERVLATWLTELLLQVVKNEEINHMGPSNLGIVFGPALFGSSEEDQNNQATDALKNMSQCKLGTDVITEIITYYRNHLDERPLLENRTPIRPNSIPISLLVTFKQDSSLSLHLAEQKKKLTDADASPATIMLDSPKVNLELQRELQSKFDNGKPKLQKKISTIFTRKRAESTAARPQLPPTPEHTVNFRTPREGRNKKRTKKKKALHVSLRRSDSDLQDLLKTFKDSDPTSAPAKQKRKLKVSFPLK